MSVEQYQYQQPGNGFLPAARQEPARRSQAQELAEWAQAAQSAYTVAESLVQTSFVPAQFARKPYEATAAILAGAEVGLSPMASLRAFDIIQGVAAPRALTLRAIVQSQGHEVWVEESTDSRAVVCGRRAGSSRTEKSIWTIDKARQMQLAGKNEWKKQPANMLVARATSELCRRIAADAILGLPYSIEEIGDGAGPEPIQATAEQVTTASPGKTARRRTAPAQRVPANTSPRPVEERPVSGPPLPGEDEELEFVACAVCEVEHPAPAHELPAEEPAVDESPQDLIDPKGPQMKRLHALLRQAEITDRDAALDLMSGVVGRSVLSSSELTRGEATAVIGRLADDGEAPA